MRRIMRMVLRGSTFLTCQSAEYLVSERHTFRIMRRVNVINTLRFYKKQNVRLAYAYVSTFVLNLRKLHRKPMQCFNKHLVTIAYAELKHLSGQTWVEDLLCFGRPSTSITDNSVKNVRPSMTTVEEPLKTFATYWDCLSVLVDAFSLKLI